MRSILFMKHYEINLTVKDVQILSGFTYNPSKIIFLKAKKSFNKKPQHWLSLQSFCSYFDINYGSAFAVLNTFYTK